MSTHSRAVVPVEAWAFSSPEIKASGRSVDIGLMAESLIYYDTILLNIGNQPQFAELLQWFLEQGSFSDFLSLIQEGTITLYEYSFLTAPVLKDGVYSLWNVQDQIQAQPNSFERRFLYHRDIEAVLKTSRQRQALYKALRDKVIEVKSELFGPALENARLDALDPRRNRIIVQAFVNELYRFRRLGRPPDVEATVNVSADGLRHDITWNISFAELAKLGGTELGFHLGTPMVAGAISNRAIWSAATMNCDLYLSEPMSELVGDKLFESANTPIKGGALIEELKARVEFPNVRKLVNEGSLKLGDVLSLRSKGGRFRTWIQSEAGRDRDAIIAYHHEVAKQAGFSRVGSRTLHMFGVLGGGAIGGAIGNAVAGPLGGALGGSAGSAFGYLADVAAKLNTDWKPVVFGDWMKSRIQTLLDQRSDDG